jgi:putative aminopeptidase FrvX
VPSPFFSELLSTPTAPFREARVRRLLEKELTRLGVPHFRDPHGNLIAGPASKAEYQRLVRTRSSEPVRFFIAHMDHPGFHGVRWRSPVELEIQWHGGSPVQHCDGARVWLDVESMDTPAIPRSGILREIKLASHGKALDTGVVLIDGPELHSQCSQKPSQISGGFAFRAPLWKEQGCFYTHAADDLVGCYAMLRAAERLFKKSKKRGASRSASKPPFIALFSRAEEVGFLGTIAHLELGWLKTARRPIVAVSLETSRTLPGADIGKGPVVRLGDRNGVFDPSGLKVLTDLAAKHLPNLPEATRHQRRIMDGGSCEATAATAYGLRSIGISVPLGNYHNQGFQGGPDCRGPEGPAPEFVHESDVQGLLTLVHAVMTPGLPWQDPWSPLRARFKKSVIGLKKHASK